ncbi:MAG: hypothetical protein IJU76_07490 [Desulfovibrionaceae bacterium]|nr:hypothetical protein [Desulfovibrionaceae bacterium]
MFKYDIPEICQESIKVNIDKAVCYRITQNNPPIEEDFLPQLFFNPLPDFVVGSECDYAGLSVYSNLNKIKKLLKRNKKLGNYIYSGEIVSQKHGPLMIIEPSKRYHLNWYQFKSVDAPSLFSQKC